MADDSRQARPVPALIAGRAAARVHDLIGRRAAVDPAAVAVVANGRTMTYAELERRSNQLAHHLIQLGVGPGVLVATHLKRVPELLVAILGVLKTGAGYVPIDAQTPWRRIDFIVREVRSPLLLTQESLADDLAGIGVPLLRLDAPGAIPDGQPGHAPALRGTALDPAYVMYTSGTTGVPNGVVVPHHALLNYLTWSVDAYDLGGGSGALVHSPIGFDLTVTTLLAPLLVGQRVILVPEDTGVRALAEALCAADDLTIVKLTPTHLKVLALLLTPEEVAGRVRTLVVGGEDLWAETLELFRHAGGPVRIVNEYGPTETVVGSCAYEVRADDPRAGRVPIGRPIANTVIHVVDAALRPVPDGTAGEALICGAGVTDGYLERPELTAERFLSDPFGTGTGERAYRTGDLVRRLPDGRLEYLGRRDDQVKIRGVRVELGEIAGVLRSHPGVAEVAVTAERQESSAPIDDVRPVAYVVAAPGPRPTAAELAEHCRRHLPSFLQPAAVHFVADLPTTPNGKLDRTLLRSLAPRPVALAIEES